MRAKTAHGFVLSLIIALFQGWAFFTHIPLSLGPRVILQPWLMQQGYVLYEHIADEHAPLMYAVLVAALAWISDGLLAAKITLVLVMSVTTVATYWAGNRGNGWLVGLLGAFFFALWSPTFGYSKLWHETFLALLYILLFIVWFPPSSDQPDRRASLLAGFISGLAVLVKQHATVLILGLILWNAFISWRTRRPFRTLAIESALFLAAASLTVLAFVIYHLVTTGTLKNLTFWTIQFSFVNNYTKYAAQAPRMDQLKLLAPAYLLLVPFVPYWLLTKERFTIRWSRQGWALLLLVASSLTAYPRFGTFHLQASLPVLAWLSATILVGLAQVRPTRFQDSLLFRLVKIGLIGGLLCTWVFRAGNIYYHAVRADQPRKIWEYSDLVPLADQIRSRIGPTDCIYILPDDEATSNLYYLTRCRPPKLWVPTSYPWFTLDEIKPDILKALMDAAPQWVVYFPQRWGIEERTPELIEYVQHHYELTAQLTWSEGEVQLWRRKLN